MSMIGELRQIPSEQMDKLKDKRVIAAIMEGDGLCLGKDWNALHFLLCGEGSSGESAVMGGRPIHGVDTGYGPPQYMTPDEVARYAGELAETTDEQLRDAFDPAAMEADDVYSVPDEVEPLLALAGEFRTYYADAASKGNGMLFFLT